MILLKRNHTIKFVEFINIFPTYYIILKTARANIILTSDSLVYLTCSFVLRRETETIIDRS